MELKELLAKRANLIQEARTLTEKFEKLAETEKRSLTEEERSQVDKLLDAAADLKDTIDREERLLEAERSAVEKREAERPDPDDDGKKGEERRDEKDLDAQERGILERLAARGLQLLESEMGPERTTRDRRHTAYDEARSHPRFKHFATAQYRGAFDAWLAGNAFVLEAEARAALEAELRALQADDLVAGGALVAPVDFQRDLIQAVDDAVYIRMWSQVRTLARAQSAGYPSLDTDPADADWTTELAVGSEDTSFAFGGRELTPHPLAKLLKISQKLLRLDPAAEALVRERLAYKFAVSMEKAGLTGTGAGQPLGIFTASANGISTGRDVSTGNTTTGIKFDGLIEAKYTLKPQYWRNARWLFHRDGTKQIAKEKDGQGQYLWRESVRVGEPDRVLGLPAFMSEFAPNTFTTGLYVGILGDFSRYWWADALGMTLQRLMELYAATNQVGFIGRLESDGMPVLEEAFVRVTLA